MVPTCEFLQGGRTALLIAAADDRMELVRLLLSNGASLEARDIVSGASKAQDASAGKLFIHNRLQTSGSSS